MKAWWLPWSLAALLGVGLGVQTWRVREHERELVLLQARVEGLESLAERRQGGQRRGLRSQGAGTRGPRAGSEPAAAGGEVAEAFGSGQAGPGGPLAGPGAGNGVRERMGAMMERMSGAVRGAVDAVAEDLELTEDVRVRLEAAVDTFEAARADLMARFEASEIDEAALQEGIAAAREAMQVALEAELGADGLERMRQSVRQEMVASGGLGMWGPPPEAGAPPGP